MKKADSSERRTEVRFSSALRIWLRKLWQTPAPLPSEQIPYYQRKQQEAEEASALYKGLFYRCSFGAIGATTLKLLSLLLLWHAPEVVIAILGFLAVLLPVLAGSALAWSNANENEARAEIYKEMIWSLEIQEKAIRSVHSDRELRRRIVETETALLRETAEWSVRRGFTTIA